MGRRQHHLPAADMSPLDVVWLFLDDQFFNEVAGDTNKSASQRLAGFRRSSRGMQEWEEVDRVEIEKFSGFYLQWG